jgi:hypothetical protein
MDVNQNVDEYLNIFQEIINTGNNIKITSNKQLQLDI